MTALNAKCGYCSWRGDSSAATSRYIVGAGAGYRCPSCKSDNIHVNGDDDDDSECVTCLGTGRIWFDHGKGPDYRKCLNCNGHGVRA